MNTDTPTPRTKAATFNARLGNPWKDEVVYASVAETLERELTAARERIAELEGELSKLSDPVAVHINMLRGTIATPSRETMEHVWGLPATPSPVPVEKGVGS